ncbi:cytochrome c [Oxalobacteraceae bacterium CAVE-383]|nr:cytochrome c [Oxalobacteraceae bacterium CAVE-383]
MIPVRKMQALLLASLVIALSGPATAMAQGMRFSQIERGRYLARAGDCAACHTVRGGADLAGGFPLATPFGTIYTPNITPDPETGIGKWSGDDFYRAMHDGAGRDGKALYPAFPFPWYTKLSRADVDAIKAYLDTVPPARQQNRPNRLIWPLNWRLAGSGWKLLFFQPGQYQADPAKSAEWNRGAYLIEGAGHCAACHAGKNLFGAVENGKDLQGGDAGDSWFAPGLSRDLRNGIGGWSAREIVEYLKTGANGKAAASGPMRDVIMDSTQYLSDADLQAMAVYLQDLPNDKTPRTAAAATTNPATTTPATTPATPPPSNIPQAELARGRGLYVDNCMGCHMAGGQGQTRAFPSLKGSASVQAAKADTAIQIVLAGGQMADPHSKPTGLAMPAFGWKLNDDDTAALVNYIRNAWGNSAAPVSAETVAAVRKDVVKSGAGRKGAVDSPY